MRNIIIYVLIKNLYALICNEFAYREEEEKMTLKDCYMQMGADYEETVQRLRSESLIHFKISAGSELSGALPGTGGRKY